MKSKIVNVVNIIRQIWLINRRTDAFRQGVVLINTVRPILFPFLAERLIAASLARRGLQVYQLLDYEVQGHYDSMTCVQEKSVSRTRRAVTFGINKLLIKLICHLTDTARCQTILLSDFIPESGGIQLPSDRLNAHVVSSLRRYNPIGELQTDSQTDAFFEESKRIAARWNSVASLVLSKFEVTTLISSHGVYATWGVMHDVANLMGLKTLVVSKCPYVPSSVWLTESAIQKINLDYDADKVAAINESAVERFFEERRQQLSPDTRVFYGTQISEKKRFYRTSSGTAGGKTFVAFPNVVWDGAVPDRDVLFESIIEWMAFTIQTISDSNHDLVVRFHPSETTMFKGGIGFYDVLARRIPRLADITNVRFIHATEKDNVFDLIEEVADCVLVYDNMTALEATYLHKPVVFCAQSRFQSAGFGYHPHSKEAYAGLLRSKDPIGLLGYDAALESDMLMRFTSWYIYDLVHTFPMVAFSDDLRDLSQSDVRTISAFPWSTFINEVIGE